MMSGWRPALRRRISNCAVTNLDYPHASLSRTASPLLQTRTRGSDVLGLLPRIHSLPLTRTFILFIPFTEYSTS
jgi:hypothetical protein